MQEGADFYSRHFSFYGESTFPLATLLPFISKLLGEKVK